MCNPKEANTKEENNFCGLVLMKMNEASTKACIFQATQTVE